MQRIFVCLTALVLVASACSSSTQPFSGDDAAPPAGDADQLPDGPSCVFTSSASLGSAGCHACAEGSCCDLGNQCLGDADCAAIIACVILCPLDAGTGSGDDAGDDGGDDDDAGSSCADTCRENNRSGIATYAAFTMCVDARCGPALCPNF